MATGAPRQGFLSRLLPASGSEQFFDLLEQHADRTREAAALLAEMLEKQVDPAQQAERDAVDHRYRLEPLALGVPDERIGDIEIVDRDGRRRQAFERVGDAVQERSEIGLFHRGIGRERRGADAITAACRAKTREVSRGLPFFGASRTNAPVGVHWAACAA